LVIGSTTNEYVCEHCGQKVVLAGADLDKAERIVCPRCNRRDQAVKASILVRNQRPPFEMLKPPMRPDEPVSRPVPFYRNPYQNYASSSKDKSILWIIPGIVLFFFSIPFIGMWIEGDYQVEYLPVGLVCLLLAGFFFALIPLGKRAHRKKMQNTQQQQINMQAEEEKHTAYLQSLQVENQRAQLQHQQAEKRWQYAMERWKKAFYCEFCDCAFIVNTQESIDLPKFQQLLTNGYKEES
jgi:DNA-directed RNA polymerase subunit RPC12/RpoP